jgi:hypothetical protein
MKKLAEIGVSLSMMGFLCSWLEIDLTLLLISFLQSTNYATLPLITVSLGDHPS